MDSREARHQPLPPPIMMMAPSSYPTTMPNSSSLINSNSVTTMLPGPRFPFNSVVSPPSKPLDSLNSTPYDGSSPGFRPCGFNIESAKKKRGRPRKYPQDGNISLGLATTPVSSSVCLGELSPTPSSDPSAKRNRGRPPGSGKKQMDALGVAGIGFTPHVITVNTGEDIVSKIMAFTQEGPRTLCILSANGAICNVNLWQPAVSGSTVTYEGRFEIISLSGSFFLPENNDNCSRPSGLRVSLAGSDGHVLGGGVAGMLMAATPVQVILGSFVTDGKKTNPNVSNSALPSASSPHILSFGAPVVAGSPPSQRGSSESSDDNGCSPINRMGGIYNNASQTLQSLQMYQIWNGQSQQ